MRISLLLTNQMKNEIKFWKFSLQQNIQDPFDAFVYQCRALRFVKNLLRLLQFNLICKRLKYHSVELLYLL
jgi:hypothetical protein